MDVLFEGEVGKRYKIVEVLKSNDAISRRLLELGFVGGQVVKVIAKSLQKKVFLVEIRGYVLSVRAEILKRVRVVI